MRDKTDFLCRRLRYLLQQDLAGDEPMERPGLDAEPFQYHVEHGRAFAGPGQDKI